MIYYSPSKYIKDLHWHTEIPQGNRLNILWNIFVQFFTHINSVLNSSPQIKSYVVRFAEHDFHKPLDIITRVDNKVRELIAVKLLHTSLLNTTVVAFKILPFGKLCTDASA